MYQTFIGLEIHIHLLTKSKVFCGCKANFGDEPNTNVCPVCMGYPGVLPSLNEEAMKLAYIVANALNCKLSKNTFFERKNYFYPDLPKNYQISQFDSPVGEDGYIKFNYEGKENKIRIHDVHLEEDAGKMIHAGDMSLLDYNRTGVPLLEIVTEPDLVTGEEAEFFLQTLRRMVRYLGVCDGNMEEGSLRCDANVSINHQGKGLGKKVEIKNLNSSRFVKKALNYEIQRQSELKDNDGKIYQETRLWNENRDITMSMRSKEGSHDYRYFPEPDLPPFRPSEDYLKEIKAALIELPHDRRERLIKDYKLTDVQADFIIEEKETADFYENTIKLGADPIQVVSWLSSDVKKILNRENIGLAESSLTEKRLAELIELLASKKIHSKIAKQVIEKVFSEDKDPKAIIIENKWEVLGDSEELRNIIDEVIKNNEKVFESMKEGDLKPMGFFLGKVMQASSGRAEPLTVQNIIKEKLK